MVSLINNKGSGQLRSSWVELASNRVFEASDPVESIAFDTKTSRLAITSHHGHIAMYNIGRNGTMTESWSARSDENKKFYDGGRKILIFVLETGEMVCRDVETSQEDWRKVLKSGIKKKCVKDGAFAEQASAIVCGSDHGKVYVFSMSSSTPIQVLVPARKTVEVQAIGTTTTSDAHFIASGSSAGMSEITVWEKPVRDTISGPVMGQSSTFTPIASQYLNEIRANLYHSVT
ncbi:hypothetical protein CPB84DRAFT_1906419 [Gymnopilus junonius]|uniref:Uncharacterized protein n=1 Tax=Gymnopilus junonius TaxID=109634 RepID=A0A9P5N998_GYMJU|nr:hypothetical protein CPB84DRAFT_1906419 [Gymnopilus junonius]